MANEIFEDPRLAELYDPLDPDRSDLYVYVALAQELGARSVLDIGCGTGTFACMLVEHGLTVTALDPAGASLDVARRKPAAGGVRWLHGYPAHLPALDVDLVTMTGNVAQMFLTDQEWGTVLRTAHGALRPGGFLVFEVRDPAREAWREWNRADSYRRVVVPGVGAVEEWFELTKLAPPLVSFRATVVFEADGDTLTSDSTLRFRTEDEVVASLRTAGFLVQEIRDAPDRPGREFVFIARCPGVEPSGAASAAHRRTSPARSAPTEQQHGQMGVPDGGGLPVRHDPTRLTGLPTTTEIAPSQCEPPLQLEGLPNSAPVPNDVRGS